uniref:Putative transposase n=1 Tax=blood disease bacterium R229 TaxID=741978 RepID=G2ZKU2_9RALS|nr:putative transposase [blood disease bacterium R229]
MTTLSLPARAKAEGAEIHWGDESGLRSDDVRGRSYAPKGQTPVVRVSNKRHGLSVISTVTNKGEMRWKIFDGALNADILIDFMQRLIRGAKKKIFLVLDNLRVHHAKPVKAWLAANKERIEAVLRAQQQPRTQPCRDPQCRSEAGCHQARTGANQAAVGQGNLQPSAKRAAPTRARQKVL